MVVAPVTSAQRAISAAHASGSPKENGRGPGHQTPESYRHRRQARCCPHCTYAWYFFSRYGRASRTETSCASATQIHASSVTPLGKGCRGALKQRDTTHLAANGVQVAWGSITQASPNSAARSTARSLLAAIQMGGWAAGSGGV